MKLTYEDKENIYNDWKYNSISPEGLAHQYGLNRENIRYMIQLADRYGIEVLKKGKNRYYSLDFKEAAIKRVLIGHESQVQVALNLKLPSRTILTGWIRAYTANGYNVVERKRGRHDSQEVPPGTLKSILHDSGVQTEKR